MPKTPHPARAALREEIRDNLEAARASGPEALTALAVVALKARLLPAPWRLTA